MTRIGPGIVIAATGVGAGDLIAASVTGARFGVALLWAAVLGALLKYVINENLARWQLVTDVTLLEGWIRRLPRAVSLYFLVYLLFWSFIVAGALIAATGLAAHALFPVLSVEAWGVLHSLLALLLVWLGAYQQIETIMKSLILVMFLVVISCALWLLPDAGSLLQGMLVPSLPDGSIVFTLGVIGGVGGSVTVLSYGYWIREKQWSGPVAISRCRTDLGVAYLLTGLFGIAVMVISAGVQPEVIKGSRMILGVAEHLQTEVGETARWLFLVGFWGAVFSSMIGVWDGIPYLFADYVYTSRLHRENSSMPVQHYNRSVPYRAYLLYLAIPPMLLLAVGKPVWVIIAYSVAGALFMPFLAAVLLYMNNQSRWLQQYRNSWLMNAGLLLCLGLFAVLLVNKLLQYYDQGGV